MNAYQAGQKMLCGDYSEYTPTGKSYFVKAKRWYTSPEVGDMVYYYSASMGRVCHVGWVTKVNKAYSTFSFVAFEGNTSDDNEFNRNGGCFARKTYEDISYNAVGNSACRINGFGRPVYGDDTCTVEEMMEVETGELGYEEKASDYRLDEKHANVGKANYTKYGKWYGDLPAQWCQQSQSWCAYQACKLHYEHLPHEETWVQSDDGNWHYMLSDGSFVKGAWKYINGRWYVFDNSGNMIKGWFQSDENWYYLGEDGGMLSGQWVMDKQNYYYLTETGVMATYCYVKDAMTDMYYWLNKDGEYEKQWDTTEPDLDKYEVAV